MIRNIAIGCFLKCESHEQWLTKSPIVTKEIVSKSQEYQSIMLEQLEFECIESATKSS